MDPSSRAPALSRYPAVFDTSPLIFLDVLGYAAALPDLHRILIPKAVAEELAQRPGHPGSGVPNSQWAELRAARPVTLRRVEEHLPRGPGEREAIALALDLSAMVVLDDKRARNYARQAGLRLTGTLGILLRIHRLGMASRTLESDVAMLEESDFRLSPAIRRIIFDEGTRTHGAG